MSQASAHSQVNSVNWRWGRGVALACERPPWFGLLDGTELADSLSKLKTNEGVARVWRQAK